MRFDVPLLPNPPVFVGSVILVTFSETLKDFLLHFGMVMFRVAESLPE